jgi:hypothetical protein
MNQLCYIMITVGFSISEPLRLAVLSTAAEGSDQRQSDYENADTRT